jgi:hypothetical protein
MQGYFGHRINVADSRMRSILAALRIDRSQLRWRRLRIPSGVRSAITTSLRLLQPRVLPAAPLLVNAAASGGDNDRLAENMILLHAPAVAEKSDIDRLQEQPPRGPGGNKPAQVAKSAADPGADIETDCPAVTKVTRIARLLAHCDR